jgi:hypothetical protein
VPDGVQIKATRLCSIEKMILIQWTGAPQSGLIGDTDFDKLRIGNYA